MSKEKAISCPNCGSQIIHRTSLRLKEKLLSYLIPTEAFKCQPCGSRFTCHDNPFAHQAHRRILVPLVLIFIFFVSLILVWVTGRDSNSPEPVIPGQESRDSAKIITGTEKKNNAVVEKIEIPPTPAAQMKENTPGTTNRAAEKEAVKIPEGTIKLGSRNRFGVNWEFDGKGLRITRLSPGPLQEAGFKIGDVLVSFDGKPLKDDQEIIKARNEVFSGVREEALIEVIRGKKKFRYKLVK